MVRKILLIALICFVFGGCQPNENNSIVSVEEASNNSVADGNDVAMPQDLNIRLFASDDESGLWGYVDNAEEWVVEPQFDSAADFICGYASVEVNEQWGVIDTSGNWVIEPAFGPIVMTEDGMQHGVLSAHKEYVPWEGIHTVASYQVGLINLQGEWVSEPIYRGDILFADGIGLAPSPYGYQEHVGIDYDGNVMIESKYKLTHLNDGTLSFYRDATFESWRRDYPDRTDPMLTETGIMDAKGNIVSIQTPQDID